MTSRKVPRNSGHPDLPPIERRRSHRCHYCTSVTLRSIRGETLGTVLNVSSDGMFIQTETRYLEGELIDLSFSYRSSKRTLALNTIVVRTAPGAIGVRIL